MNDSKHLAAEIEYHADQFITTVSSFYDDQINTVPFPGSWTAGQVARHIIKATGAIPDGKIAPTSRPTDEKVKLVESVFLDFTQKYQSPEFVTPEPGPYNQNELIRELTDIKNQNIHFALTKDLSALCMDFELPVFGHLTRYEWLKFFNCHTQRHLHQLKKISNSFIHLGSQL